MSNQDFFRDTYSETDSHNEEKEYTIAEIVAIIDDGVSDIATMVEEKKYDLALPKLLSIYEIFVDRSIVSKLDDEMGTEEFLARFAWICFRICYCYIEQDDYVRAYFYIDQVKSLDSNCLIEWINVLVNSGRMDALGVVEDLVNDPSELKDICKDEADVKKVMDFLERRLGYLYIDYGEYEEARKLFTRLLEVPASRDFAQSELDYIDTLQNKCP